MAGQVKRRGGIFARNPTRHGQFAMVQPQVRAKGRRDKLKPTRLAAQPWQAQAFEFTTLVGELGYVVHLTANLMAACGLQVMERPPDGSAEFVTEDERAMRVLNAFVGPRGGHAELLRRAGLHLTIAGESYLLGTPAVDAAGANGGIDWEFVSNQELRIDERGAVTRRPDGMSQALPLPEDVYVARMWESDPTYSDQATSPVRRILPIAAEIVTLTQMVDAVARSRLAAGLLYVPNEMDFPTDTEADEDLDPSDEAGRDGASEFSEELLSHLSAPIEDRTSAASLVPLIVRGPGDMADKLKPVDLGKPTDTWSQSLRTEALERLAKGLDIPPEVLKGKTSLSHWCVDEATEVMTLEGWRTHESLAPGDVVLTLNHDTGLSEWQPVKDVARFDVVDLEMVSIEAPSHSSLTTPNHRWPTLKKIRDKDEQGRGRVVGKVRHWTTSERLNTNDSLVTAAPAIDVPTEAKWSDAFVELVAWFWTEGSCRYRPGRDHPQVAIYQSTIVNGPYCDRIRRALTALYGPPTDGPLGTGGRGAYGQDDTPRWREYVKSNGMAMWRLNNAAARPLVEVAPARVVQPSFIREMTRAQLDLFIDASICADGTRLTAGTEHIGQSKRERLAGIELACALTGRPTNLNEVLSHPGGDRWLLSIRQNPIVSIGRKRVERQTYTGTVWCPVTANSTWLARRKGKAFYTGNTSWNLDADLVIRHVGPKLQLAVDFLTVAFLRPMLEEYEDLAPEEAGRFRLHGDISTILGQADEAAGATTLFDRTALAESALRSALGFTDADAPDDDERRRRTAMALILAAPAIFAPSLLPTLPGFEGVVVTVPTGAPDGAGGPAAPPGSTPSTRNPGMPDPADKAPVPQSVIRDVTVASDAALERALERAASKIISRVEKDVTVRDRIAAARDKRSALATLGPSDLMQVGVTPEQLLEGAWDQLADKAYRWVLPGLEAAQVVFPDQAARSMTLRLVAMLDEYAKVHLHSQPTVGPNGLRVPDELVEAALRLEGVRGAS